MSGLLQELNDKLREELEAQHALADGERGVLLERPKLITEWPGVDDEEAIAFIDTLVLHVVQTVARGDAAIPDALRGMVEYATTVGVRLALHPLKHEIEIMTRNSNEGMRLAAVCACGWSSAAFWDNDTAIEAGERHLQMGTVE